MRPTGTVVGRLRQPEYTGENRCTPCTVANLAIVGAASLAVGALAPVAGAAVAAFGVVAIYLRGYLVPGTPALTKRYVPDRVLRRFDKQPATALETDVDTEEQLLAIDAVEPTAGDDLRLTDAFAAEWESSIERFDRDPEARTAAVLGLSDAELREAGEGWLVLEGDTVAARWPSRAALVADLAAVPVLRGRTTNWERLPEADRRGLLVGLRVFLDSCPDCEGVLSLSRDTVESCCRTYELLRYGCDGCGAQLFEIEQ